MRWVEVHAKLLDRYRDAQALTASQANAAAAIASALSNGVPYLNLWGSPGVGKTFLARHLVYKHEGIYLSSPDQPLSEPLTGRWVCVDNMRSSRADTRAAYSRLTWQRASAVIIITQAAIPDSLFSVQLQLTADDFRAVHTALVALLRNPALLDLDTSSASLWMLVRAGMSADQLHRA